MKLIAQYKGLRKENYILFIGRIVTNMGSMIWPVLTLILTQKLKMTAADASIFMIAVGVIELPLGLLGGKIADKYNKKHVIVLFDAISIIFFYVCAFLPLNIYTILLLVVGSFFQSLEGPSYTALIADISYTKDRERAYSLSYLGMNLGLVASPIIAGYLFEDYLWLSFLISGTAIGISTLLIFLFVRDITPVDESEDETAVYQTTDDNSSTFAILRKNKVIFLYIVIMAFFWCAYGQYSFLLPIDLATVHGSSLGAKLFGSVSSINCIVVVILTPILTHIFAKLYMTKKNLVGVILVIGGYLVFLLGLGLATQSVALSVVTPIYFISMITFTLGEIFSTLANGPYLTDRIPASHRGRINGVLNIIQQTLAGVAMFAIGQLHTLLGSQAAWTLVMGLLVLAFIGSVILIVADKKAYPKLYIKS